MALDLSPGNEVHTIWFVGWGYGDFMAYVFKRPGEPWIGEYRFRYHTAPTTGDPFNEDDEKSFYTYHANNADDPPDPLVAMMEMVCSMTAQHYQADLFDTLEIKGTSEDAMRELEKQSWCFMKRAKSPKEVNDADGQARN